MTLQTRSSAPNNSWKHMLHKFRRSKSRKIENEEPRNAVLLLFSMDGTNRFELLSLQSIRETATVANIFEHVTNCKEEALKEQEYQGILTDSCDSLIPMKETVSHCCGQNSVLVAVPVGSNVISCTRSAVTLLSDSIINLNLQMHGFDSSGWTTRRKKKLQFLSESSPSKRFQLKSRRFSWRMRDQSSTSSTTTPEGSDSSI